MPEDHDHNLSVASQAPHPLPDIPGQIPQSGQTKRDVILVVKGAGLHEPDEVLNTFTEGFWPAVQKIDKKATIRQRSDVLDDYVPSAHDENPHKHLVEITTRDQVIWIKEVYWEPELQPPNPFRALLDEWHMATFAFRREFTMLLRRLLEDVLNRLIGAFQSRTSVLPTKTAEKVDRILEETKGKPKATAGGPVDALSIFFSYWLSFLILFTWIWRLYRIEDYLLRQNRIEPGSLWPLGIILMASFVMTWPSFLRIHSRYKLGTRLPGFQYWLLVLLGVAVLISPFIYLLQLLQLAIVVIVINVIRAFVWKKRPFKNVGTDYFLGELTVRENETIHVSAFPFAILHFFYRWFVIWALPIAFPLLLISRLFKWLDRLGLKQFGSSIEEFISAQLSSGLGDVSAYAMSTSQAMRVRSVLETDIQFFDRKCDHIHVFAHSQGTAIAWETLFVHLQQKYRSKIKTYVTIGSVLTYYHHTSPVLSKIFPSHRFRHDTCPDFADDFQWFNCWNLADQVTGFHGLEEYRIKSENSWIPIEVKTRSPLLSGHSDYWNNIDEVFLPFANRLLGTNSGKVWPEENEYDSSHPSVSRWNRRLSFMIVPALLVVFGAFFQGDATMSELYPGVRGFSLINGMRESLDFPESVGALFAWIEEHGFDALSTILSLYLISIVLSTASLFRKIARLR
ncbi:MAG: hypothetical protein IIC78_12850 [Chloroflexi bacterium]|nr:hypothetical protein [Chloroflexota bacterium]